MPRPLVLGNGNLLVTFDHTLSIRDFTFPCVGLLNHLSGNRIRLGLWVAGQFDWLDSPEWHKTLDYESETLVTRSICRHERLNVTLVVSDCVSHRENVLLRRFEITNHADDAREARLFLSSDFHIAETDIGDTALYDPSVDAIIHYKRDYYFLIAGQTPCGGIFQYTTGIKGFGGAEGTWRDAEDGWLSMNPVEQGSVDSTLSFKAIIAAGGTAAIRSWICAGKTMAEVKHLHSGAAESFEAWRGKTANYWKAWAKNERTDSELEALPVEIGKLFRRSLLIIRTQIDNRGAILAANDSDIMETARAHYSYMWPRDGALVAAALDRLSYQDITRRFFLFCRQVLPEEYPILMHKYSADGSWGATWHPWIVDGKFEVPFQQDSTALVLWSLWRHYERHHDIEFVEKLYDTFVVPTSDFIVAYRDEKTHLPLPSYDLWEERRGIHAYSCGTVYGALQAAANLSALFQDGRSVGYLQSAQEIQAAIETHFWCEESHRFARRLIRHPDGSVERDMTLDSALYALFAFGAFPARHPKLAATMQQVLERLRVRTAIGGMARYENDYYFRRSEDIGNVPGSPWIICTLWAAQYHIARAETPEELQPALELLLWAAHRAETSGVLSEQVHPYTGLPLSVSPLTWSHAEYVSTTLQYLEKWAALKKM